MTKTMQERFEQAKVLQKEIADKRINKKYKTALPLRQMKKERDGLLMEQVGLCAICEVPVSVVSKRYHLDHDHDTGEIRGVLCHGCNVGLGMFKESPERLLKAIDYLNKFRLEKFDYKIKEDYTKEEVKEIVTVWWKLFPDLIDFKYIKPNQHCNIS